MGFPSVDDVLTTPALLAAVSGLALGLGLIVAIGAQNAFVLRQGLRLEHVAAVVAVCALSDLALIMAGVLGAGAALSRVSWLVPVVCFAGAAFLLGYGVLAAGRALRPGALLPDAAGTRAGLAATVGTCLALTWLNPHVYLDTVVLLGSMASTFGEHRWPAAPAGVRPPAAWRVLDGGIAVVMTALAVSLAVRGLSGT
jgi:L-lysine exporter family protein LysE/ArgO